MKKIIITSLIVLFLVILLIVFTKNKENSNNDNLEKIKVAEVTHSIFYAPFYVAIENGYFEKNGLDIDLILTSGADKVSAAVLSKDVHIGLAGAESAMYIFNSGEKDYLQLFSSLTKRDGQFILGRKDNKDFKLKDLVGKEVLVGRKGGMPALNFINALENEGIDPKDVKLNYQIDFASLSGAFISDNGDYVNLFEPNATTIEKQNYGYILTSIGKYSGEMPYTTFYARKSYIDENKDVIVKFKNSIDEGLKYVLNNDSEDIAKIIKKQFPDNSIDELSQMIDNYKEFDSWTTSSTINQESFYNLQDLLIKNTLIEDYIKYEDLVFEDAREKN